MQYIYIIYYINKVTAKTIKYMEYELMINIVCMYSQEIYLVLKYYVEILNPVEDNVKLKNLMENLFQLRLIYTVLYVHFRLIGKCS